MPADKIEAFGGMVPAVDDRLLPAGAAAYAENTRVSTGKLTGLPVPRLIRSNTVGTQKVFRIPLGELDGAHIADSLWLEFANWETDVVKAPVVGDTYERYYWASSTAAPRYNSRARIAAGNTGANAPYLLGIPQPAAVSVSHSGGVSAITETRAYVATWVSTFGEEGPPSTPYLVTGKVDDTFTVTLTAAAADDIAGPDRDIAHTNIYRTITGSDGTTTYFFVAQVAVATLTYADTLSDAVVASHSALESTGWTGPPSDLEGWVAMPNGMIVGWRKNELWFSEPYRPHAWPVSYVLAMDFNIVGLGVTNQTLVICTESVPMTGAGVHPSVFSTSKIKSTNPCMSRASILSTALGVYYASPNGLMLVTQGAASNYTEKLFTKEAWQRSVYFTTMRAAALGGAYFSYGSVLPGVFQADTFQANMFQQTDFGGALNGVLIDPDPRIALTLLATTEPIQGVQNDDWSGELLMLYGDKTYLLDMSAREPVVQPYKWRSKVFQANEKKNFGVVRVYFETTAGTPGLNPTRNTNLVQTLGANQYGLLRVYADERLVMCKEIRTSGEILRMPSGFKADYWQIEIEARVDIFSIQWASSVKALASA